MKDHKIGYINQRAEIVIPARFDWAGIFSYNAPVIVVCTGCYLEKPKLHETYGCDGNRSIVGGKWGIIDNKGKFIIPLEFDSYVTDTDNAIFLLKGKQKYKLFCNNIGLYKLIEHSDLSSHNLMH